MALLTGPVRHNRLLITDDVNCSDRDSSKSYSQLDGSLTLKLKRVTILWHNVSVLKFLPSLVVVDVVGMNFDCHPPPMIRY